VCARACIYGAKLITRRQTYTHIKAGTTFTYYIIWFVRARGTGGIPPDCVVESNILFIYILRHYVGIYTHDDNYYHIEAVSPSTVIIILLLLADQPTSRRWRTTRGMASIYQVKNIYAEMTRVAYYNIII